jgi:uncharacterized protein (DUF1330 family)
MKRHPSSDQAPTIVEMPALADPQLLAMYRMVCADAIREFGARAVANAGQREILHRMARLNARFTSTDVPKVGK